MGVQSESAIVINSYGDTVRMSGFVEDGYERFAEGLKSRFQQDKRDIEEKLKSESDIEKRAAFESSLRRLKIEYERKLEAGREGFF